MPRVRSLALILLLLGSAGCSRQECQRLCTAWYDYQRDVCGQLDNDDQRVTCVSDYRPGRTTDEEVADCAERRVEVAALRANNDATCCTWGVDDCPFGAGDDDSADP